MIEEQNSSPFSKKEIDLPVANARVKENNDGNQERLYAGIYLWQMLE